MTEPGKQAELEASVLELSRRVEEQQRKLAALVSFAERVRADAEALRRAAKIEQRQRRADPEAKR